jgi:hypothetical protein
MCACTYLHVLFIDIGSNYTIGYSVEYKDE